jgi:hypothetical protein
MAIGATLLTSNYDNANQTSYTTASISPAANSLLLMWVYDAITTPIVSKGVPTGLSLTWEEIGTRAQDDGEKRLSLFIAQCGGSPGSGTITITEADMGGGTTAIGCAWSIIQVTGHHTTYPVRQPVFPVCTIAANTSYAVNFPQGAADSNSRCFAAVGAAVSGGVTERASWTELSDNSGASPTVSFATQWRSDAFEATASGSYGSATDVLLAAVEIAEASAPDPVDAATIADRAFTLGVADSTITATMPNGVTAGDLLIAAISTDGNTSAAAGGGEGWTNITDAANGSDVRLNILAKVAAGGDALNLTLGAAVDSATHVMRIVDHGVSSVATDVEVGTAATGTSTAPNPPSVTPAANAKNLFIAVAASDDDDDSTAFAPTNYTGEGQGQSAATATACLIQVAYRYVTTGSAEDPGAFTLAASEQWVTQSLCVPPAASSATGTAAVTEAADTSSAVGAETFTGTVAVTEAVDTSTASGTHTENVTGTVATTEAADTSAASGTETFTGTAAVTESDDTSTASGAETFTGTSATTEEADTSTASGTHIENATGTVAVTEADDTSIATGAETFTGTSTTTEADDTSSASGTLTITGTATASEADDTSTAAGTVTVIVNGDIAATLHPVSTFAPAAAVSTFEPATTVHTFKPATTVRTFNA